MVAEQQMNAWSESILAELEDAQRALLVTEAYRKHENEPQPIKVAQALAHVLRNVRLEITEDQLLVGNGAAPPKACPIFPEFCYSWIEDELKNNPIRERPHNVYEYSDETEQAVARALVPDLDSADQAVELRAVQEQFPCPGWVRVHVGGRGGQRREVRAPGIGARVGRCAPGGVEAHLVRVDRPDADVGHLHVAPAQGGPRDLEGNGVPMPVDEIRGSGDKHQQHDHDDEDRPGALHGHSAAVP